MSRLNRSAPLFASIAALSLLLVLAACSDNQGKGNEPTAVFTPTPAPKPTPTPFYTPTPTPGYDVEQAWAEFAAVMAVMLPTPEPIYDVEEARAELAAAKALWRVGGSTDYELESLVVCECPESTKPLKITVRGGVIESVIDLESGRSLTEREYNDTYTFHTIGDRFDQIEDALRDPWPVYDLGAEYHPDVGYPTYLGINYSHDVIDAGFELQRLIYKPLDPSPPPATSTLSLGMEGRRASVLDLFCCSPNPLDVMAIYALYQSR